MAQQSISLYRSNNFECFFLNKIKLYMFFCLSAVITEDYLVLIVPYAISIRLERYIIQTNQFRVSRFLIRCRIADQGIFEPFSIRKYIISIVKEWWNAMSTSWWNVFNIFSHLFSFFYILPCAPIGTNVYRFVIIYYSHNTQHTLILYIEILSAQKSVNYRRETHTPIHSKIWWADCYCCFPLKWNQSCRPWKNLNDTHR